MFIRLKESRRPAKMRDWTTQMVLLESYRDKDTRQPRQRYIAYLGTFKGWNWHFTECTHWEREEFWRKVDRKLDRLELEEETRRHVETQIAHWVPRKSREWINMREENERKASRDRSTGVWLGRKRKVQ